MLLTTPPLGGQRQSASYNSDISSCHLIIQTDKFVHCVRYCTQVLMHIVPLINMFYVAVSSEHFDFFALELNCPHFTF